MQAGKEKQMPILTRRSVLRGTLGIPASRMLARPHLANAAATTATVWWTQGIAEEEDVSFKKIVADYEKANGNTIDYTITPYAPLPGTQTYSAIFLPGNDAILSVAQRFLNPGKESLVFGTAVAPVSATHPADGCVTT
jgi:hypothetical protein